MRVLGIDPGVEITGFGLVDVDGNSQTLVECGVIRTPVGEPLPQRLNLLAQDLSSLLDSFGALDLVGVEELFFSKNAKTAFMVGQARGVILYTVAAAGFTIQEVKPVEVKSVVVGSGNAGKKEVQRMVQMLFGLDAPPEPDDAADAAAIALAAAAISTSATQ